MVKIIHEVEAKEGGKILMIVGLVMMMLKIMMM